MSESGAEDSCFVCKKKKANTRQLPCRHVLCLDCIRNIVKHDGGRNTLACSACRETYAIAKSPGENPELSYVRDTYGASIVEIHALKHDGKVMGMAMLDQKLFVVCKSPPNVIFGYDILTEATQTMNPFKVNIPDLKWPRGMAANGSLKCLYITDWKKIFGGRLWRYKTTTGDIFKIEIDIQPFGVSVSPHDNRILVSCATPVNIFVRMGWIYEYKDIGVNLQFIRKLELQDIEIPRHAILTDSSKYLVCHGWTIKSHGVTSYRENELGHVTKAAFYGSASGSGKAEMEMDRPLSMTLDENGYVLVVDYYNNRIQLLTEDLRMVRHLITKEQHGIEYPRHVCVSSRMGRMYVGLEDGTVHIYNTCI